MNQNLTSIDKEEKYFERNFEGKKLTETKSFQTNVTSSPKIIESWKDNKEKKSPIGMVFKANINDLFKTVFVALKKMNIVWKKWNSDFIYKCQTGVPLSKNESIDIRKDHQAMYDNDSIKFFVHFS